MSKGLGKLQREIMDRCRSFWTDFETPTRDFEFMGRRSQFTACRGFMHDPEFSWSRFRAFSHGQSFELRPPNIDLRVVKKRMVEADASRKEKFGYATRGFDAAFSRAVHQLVKRRLMDTGDNCGRKEIRFVRLRNE